MKAKQHHGLEIFGQGRRIMFWNLETSDPMSHVAEANCMSARYGTHGHELKRLEAEAARAEADLQEAQELVESAA